MLRARSEEAKDKRKIVLLNAALDEFFERGFNAARMEDIAKRAALSKGTLYLYFDSKQALFQALIEEIALPTLGRTSRLVEDASSATEALTRLMTHIPQIIRNSPMPKLMKVLVADCRVFPELALLYRQQVIDKALIMIEGILQRGSSSREWRVDDVHLTARLVVAPMIFSVIWRVTFENIAPAEGEDSRSELDLEGLFALHSKFLLAALTAGQE